MRLGLTRIALGIAICLLVIPSTTKAQIIPFNLTVSNETQQGVGAYRAFETITASDITISSGADWDFNATDGISISSGLSVALGAELSINNTLPADCAKSLPVCSMPLSLVNTRHSSLQDVQGVGVRRPALSVTGFSNTQAPFVSNYGLGLKQILDQTFNDENPLLVELFQLQRDIANRTFQTPVTNHVKLDANSNIIQARAFMALATYVIELNDPSYTPTNGIILPSHVDAMSNFKDAIVNPPSGVLVDGEGIIGDAVRWARSIGNMARAIDLYLAIENAYAQNGEPESSRLLSESEKTALMVELQGALHDANYILAAAAKDVAASSDWRLQLPLQSPVIGGLFSAISQSSTATVAETEPGNRPLKLRTALGYGSLALQCVNCLPSYADFLENLHDEAVAALAPHGSSNQNRIFYWNYQTQGGSRFWAEGPYYMEFALQEVIPFWHATRALHMMNYYGTNVSDPFDSSNSWFLNPINWLADIVTPDGKVPPTDDGNKRSIRYANMMRWAPEYGDGETGEKYAWIEEKHKDLGVLTEEFTSLVALSIPRTTSTQAPQSSEGNYASPFDNDEQQLILRSTDNGGSTHYVLLNGERGDAVERGEGHEQADQLQLLYYIDGISYLVDTGYDEGSPTENSEWNHYSDHNVMVYDENKPTTPPTEGEGGLEPPELDIFLGRKVSDKSKMGEAGYLYIIENTGSNLTILRGGQSLSFEASNYGWQVHQNATYKRDVLFVAGTDPYLIDINNLEHDFSAYAGYRKFEMSYHMNTLADPTGLDYYKPRTAGFLNWDPMLEGNKNLYMYPMSVEYELINEGSGGRNDTQLEYLHDMEETNGSTQYINKVVFRDVGVPYWTVANMIMARATPTTQHPELIWTYNSDYLDSSEQQGWVWNRGANVYDVFVARSSGDFYTKQDLFFNTNDAVSYYPDLPLTLDAADDYGFARVILDNGNWTIDPQYQYNIVEGSAPSSKMHASRDSLIVGEDAEVLDQTGVNSIVPKEHALDQNSPNPFSSSTHIKYALASDEHVRIEIFNALGQKVSTLVDSYQEAGYKSVAWDGRNDNGVLLPSGTYLYRINTGGGYEKTKTMVLLN